MLAEGEIRTFVVTGDTLAFVLGIAFNALAIVKVVVTVSMWLAERIVRTLVVTVAS